MTLHIRAFYLNHNIKFNISNINIKQNVSIIPLSEFNSVEWFPVKIWEWGLVEGDNYSVQQSVSNQRYVRLQVIQIALIIRKRT